MKKMISFCGDRTALFEELNRQAKEYAAAAGIAYQWLPGIARDRAAAVQHLRQTDCAIIGMEPYDQALLQQLAPHHPLLVRFGVGYEKVDLKAASACGIPVARTTGANAGAVAEMAVALIFACRRELRFNRCHYIESGRWTKKITNETIGGTIGILGFGNIGRITARHFRNLGCEVLVYDPYLDQTQAQALGVKPVDLDTLFRRADAISIHVPHTEQTHHLVNGERLGMMKETAVIVNTSRGGIVDEQALYQALKAHQIRGAALDVFDQEPLPVDSPLLELDNLILTPHISSQTFESLWNVCKMAIDIARDHFSGRDSVHILNPEYKKFL